MKKLKGIISASLLAVVAATAFVMPQSVGAAEFNEETINATETVTSMSSTKLTTDSSYYGNNRTVATELPTEAETEELTQLLTDTPPQPPTENPTEAPTELSAVNGLTYSNVTTNSITLNWEKNENATGYIIYRMDRNTNGKYVRRTMIKDNQTTSYKETDLTPARSYYYQVKAYLYQNGTFYYSDTVIIKLATMPDTVQGLGVTANAENKISIKWNKVDGADGYIVYRMDYKTNNQYKQIAAVNNTVTRISNTNLESGRAYYYRVCAYKDVPGIRFTGDYQTLKTATLPAAITNLRVLEQSSSQITINWDKVVGANGYIIYRMDSSTNGQYKNLATVEGNANVKYTDKNLLAGRAYYYRVRPYKNVAGKNYYGSFTLVKTGTKTAVPSYNLKSNNKNITASWTKVSGAEGYTFYLSESKNGTYRSQGSTTTASFTTKALTPGKTYYVRVAAFNLIDNKRIYSNYRTKTIVCKNLSEKYNNLGNTFVEVSIADQYMWFYKNGECLVSTPVVTGMKNSHDTPKGVFRV
ncbi:MAG: fibronectin type III domain-containing protein, partial [Acutalibacteraceae bacterium]|nr:fibronectin type III domain-containing protein [Acutalibacteraceae bacterium]